MFSKVFCSFSREKLEARRESLDPSVLRQIEGIEGELQTALAFLYGTLPLSDLKLVPFDALLKEARGALRVWKEEVPEDIFINYVLCPRVNNETLEPSRDFFYDALQERTAGLSTEEAALAVNRWCCEQVNYQASDNRTEGPMTAYKSGKGRCGEESVFTVYALRSVGIPARQVYAPWWSHCDDNHAWVEVYVQGQWRFLGACEPEPVLNKGWFLNAASRAMLVHGRAFSAYRGAAMEKEEVIEEREGALLYNATARYAPTALLTVEVRFPNGALAAGAKIHCQVLNMGDWRTIACLTADAQGRGTLTCGKGSLRLTCAHEGLYGKADIHTGENAHGVLILGEVPLFKESGDFLPPETGAVTPPPVTKEAEEENRRFLPSAGLNRILRQMQYLKEARDTLEWRDFASWDAYIEVACGNGKEIARYLKEGTELAGDWAEKLLRTLPEKDLRDTETDTLLGYLKRAMEHLPAYAGRETLFMEYVLCPRIGTEKLGTPLCLMKGEERAAATLRRQGEAARLNPFTGTAEVWKEGRFVPLAPHPTGFLTVAGEGDWRFSQNWSLALYTEEGFVPLPKGQFCEEMELPAGIYGLTSLVRTPSGKQRYIRRQFALKAGEKKIVVLHRPTVSAEDMLVEVPLPQVFLHGENNPVPLKMSGDKPLLLLFLQPGAEPTAHILNELMETGSGLSEKADFWAALPLGDDKEETFLKFLNRFPKTEVYWDWFNAQETLARSLFLEPRDYPLLFLLHKGKCRFARGGYAVGTAELLERILECLRLPMNIYETCPVLENERFLIRPLQKSDCAALLKVYSDKNALPFFNSDNCNGDNFYYATEERMQEALDFWMLAYKKGWFVRLSIVDKTASAVVGTVELCLRVSEDAFHHMGILRVDVGSAYEQADALYSIFSLVAPKLEALLGCKGVLTKAPLYAVERIQALEKAGFTKSEHLLGGKNGRVYDGYWTMP